MRLRKIRALRAVRSRLKLLVLCLALDPFEHFFSMNRHIGGSVDADANLTAFDVENGHFDVVPDDDGFADTAA